MRATCWYALQLDSSLIGLSYSFQVTTILITSIQHHLPKDIDCGHMPPLIIQQWPALSHPYLTVSRDHDEIVGPPSWRAPNATSSRSEFHSFTVRIWNVTATSQFPVDLKCFVTSTNCQCPESSEQSADWLSTFAVSVAIIHKLPQSLRHIWLDDKINVYPYLNPHSHVYGT